MKIALVHDQLCEFGGAERVLIALKNIFPQTDIFTSVYNPITLGKQEKMIKTWKIKTSWFNKIPVVNRLYSPLRFLTPFIWESFDFSNYDLVISSTGSWMSKGIITKKPTIHISYIHHPPRYLYGYETAIEWQQYWPVKIYGHIINNYLRLWDYQASQRPDYLIANSQETRKRIKKFYHRDATVIYPPVIIPLLSTVNCKLSTVNYYLTVSRLARAKHVDVLIKAANKYQFNLKIVGHGRDKKYLRSIAGNTVQFLGRLADNELNSLYQNAKAFLFASVDEEFGIAPVEAMGYSLPIIAYQSGGIPEYLKNGINGFLFDNLNENSLIDKIKSLERLTEKKYLVMKSHARKTAENFTEEKFKSKLTDFINKVTSYKL